METDRQTDRPLFVIFLIGRDRAAKVEKEDGNVSSSWLRKHVCVAVGYMMSTES